MVSNNISKKETNISSAPIEEIEERAVPNQNRNTVIDIPEESRKNNKSKATKKEKKHVNFFKQFLLPRVYITAFCVFLIMIVFNISYGIVINYCFKNVTNSNEEAIEEDVKLSPVLMNVYVCILGPILEELIFRRLIFWLVNKFSKVLAYIISSFLFAFLHFDFSFKVLISEYYFFPLYFILGMALAYAYDRDGYILASILAHIFHNSFAVLLDYI